jgi:cytidyltransferase-like protein
MFFSPINAQKNITNISNINLSIPEENILEDVYNFLNKNCAITFGVYDFFHKGHKNLLLNAKKYGLLIVGVLTDKIVRETKNILPTMNEIKRIENIQSLPYVNKVFLTEKDNNQRMEEILKCKKCKKYTIIMGSDHKDNDLILKLKKKLNCEVIILPRTRGISSTKIRKYYEKK